MGVKIGEIDIAQQALDSEFRLGVLERLIERIMKGEPTDQQKLNEIRKEVVRALQKKYPNSGIDLKQR